VERAIGRIKRFDILSGTIPISMVRLTNLFICAFLTNFQPALVPLSKHCSTDEVHAYFNELSSESDSEVDFDE
jgi:hypothetical protein